MHYNDITIRNATPDEENSLTTAYISTKKWATQR